MSSHPACARSSLLFDGHPALRPDRRVALHVDTESGAAGGLTHRLTMEARERGAFAWRQETALAIEAPYPVTPPPNLDAFVLLALFSVLGFGGTLDVRGTVSRSLLRNLHDLQAYWAMVRPDRCQPFAVEADSIVDPQPPAGARGIMAFTGGLDSTLTLVRNQRGAAGPTGHPVEAAMFLYGFGTGVRRPMDPDAVRTRLLRTTDRVGVPLAMVSSDLVSVFGDFEIAHGAWIAGCLQLFSGRFDLGVIASSPPMVLPGYEAWGSRSVVDPLLSGGAMEIRNDEGLYHRVDKAALISRFPEVLPLLYVCAQARGRQVNCGRCEKCVRTMLCFIAAGKPVPAAFPDGLDPTDIGVGMRDHRLVEGRDLIARARAYGTDGRPELVRLARVLRVKRLKRWIRRLLPAPLGRIAAARRSRPGAAQ